MYLLPKDEYESAKHGGATSGVDGVAGDAFESQINNIEVANGRTVVIGAESPTTQQSLQRPLPPQDAAQADDSEGSTDIHERAEEAHPTRRRLLQPSHLAARSAKLMRSGEVGGLMLALSRRQITRLYLILWLETN